MSHVRALAVAVTVLSAVGVAGAVGILLLRPTMATEPLVLALFGFLAVPIAALVAVIARIAEGGSKQ